VDLVSRHHASRGGEGAVRQNFLGIIMSQYAPGNMRRVRGNDDQMLAFSRMHLSRKRLLIKEETAIGGTTMTWAEPIPEKSIVMVGDEQGTIVQVYHGGESYEIEFGSPPRSRAVLAREISAVIQVPPGSN
jgi:hypothetical protein